MENLNSALASVIPDVRKGVFQYERPRQAAEKMATNESSVNGKKTGPYGQASIGRDGVGGELAKLSQFPTLQVNNPYTADNNMTPFSMTPSLPNTELDANRAIPYQRLVAPMASGVPMVLKKGQIVFTNRNNTGARGVRSHSNMHAPFANITELGYGNSPTWTVDIVTLNYIILKEQLEMYLDMKKGKNDNYKRLDPTYFIKDWRVDGIVTKDSVPASSMNLYQKCIIMKRSQVECQNYWGGDYETGDELYLIIKKYEAIKNDDLDRIYEDCQGLGFRRYPEDISNFRPYQFGAFTAKELQTDPLARQYKDDNPDHPGLTRYDGLPIHIGRVWAEPRFHSRKNGSYGKDYDGLKTSGHALRNPKEGISSETMTNLVIIMNSDDGVNPF